MAIFKKNTCPGKNVYSSHFGIISLENVNIINLIIKKKIILTIVNIEENIRNDF